MPFTVAQIAEQVRGEVIGDGSVVLTGFAAANQARSGDLTFAEKEEYFVAAEQSQASAILVAGDFKSAGKVLIRVKNPRIAVARLLPVFFPVDQYSPGVHPSAVIDATAQVDPTAHIGPNCVIGARARIGARTALLGGTILGTMPASATTPFCIRTWSFTISAKWAIAWLSMRVPSSAQMVTATC